MRLIKAFHSASLFGISFLAAFFVAACAQPPVRHEPDSLFWPAQPEKPRIKYVQSIYREDDLGREYSFLEKIFGKGYLDSMVRPYGVSVTGGKLYVTDIVSRSVTVYDLDRKRLIAVISGRDARFRMPAAAVSDKDGNIYVADSGGSSVIVYNHLGLFRSMMQIPGGKPVGLALNDKLGRLYVSDRERHRIVVFDLKGTLLFEFGARGTDKGKFNIPLALTVDGQNRVYVLDSGNFRVQIFDADGAFLSKFGEVGDQPGAFANPKGIAVDSEGHIYITDAAFSNYQIFDQQGHVLLNVGEFGTEPGYLHLPAGIAISEHDRIYIADQLNSRIQVFQYLRESGQRAQP